MKTVDITIDWLVRLGACEEAMEIVEAHFPDGYHGPWGPVQQAAMLMGPLGEYLGWLWEYGVVPQYSMAGWSMHSAALNCVDLRGVDLRGAKAHHAELVAVSFDDARLDGACLRRANMSGARFTSATLTDADLRGASLGGADLRFADLRRADLRGAGLYYPHLRGADLRGADLRGAVVVATDFEGVTLDDSGEIHNQDVFQAKVVARGARATPHPAPGKGA